MTTRTDRPSYWITTVPPTRHARLEEDAETDVLVVGGGITGLTAAYHLGKEGVDTMVLDRHAVALAESGHTTAHAAFVVDTRLQDLARMHGQARAKAVWDAGAHAVALIERVSRDEGIDCDFRRVDGLLYGPRQEDAAILQREVRLARRFGYDADLLIAGDVPEGHYPEAAGTIPDNFPFAARAVMRVPGQARFHPRKYLTGLLGPLDAFGVRVHGDTEVRRVDPRGGTPERPVVAHTADGHVVRAKRVIVASHEPFVDRFRMWTKLYPYRSYVIAARIPTGRVPDALYWDTLDPYHYARLQPEEDADVVIFGGEDHKTGHERDTERRFESLEIKLREELRIDFDVEWRWSAQDPETLDDLPYIGVNPGSPEHEFIATGYGGNGMTYGTLAGWMLAERILGRGTQWDAMFDPARRTVSEARTYVSENATYPKELVKGYLQRTKGPSIEDLRPGEGAVVTHGARKFAVSRDPESGEFRACSAICTHAACTVNWNTAEGSWDCPCHGSRFAADGSILDGPAKVPLKPASLDEAGIHPAERDRARR